MVQVSAADIALARDSGIAVTLCPQSNLRSGLGAPPLSSWAQTGLRLGIGSDDRAPNLDLWSELRLLALLPGLANGGNAAFSAWDALTIATQGGAAALGLDEEIGTLQIGKWADLCCLDLDHPAMRCLQADDPAPHLVFNGGRDLVRDVWVGGRHLLNDGVFTRLELMARRGTHGS
jgi:5-methylthioadenosine/S-adenosylhomocysteine deaminase